MPNQAFSAHSPTRILVTGGAGFIGSCYVRHLLANVETDRVVTLDALTYAGRRESLGSALTDPRHVFVHGTICDSALVRALLADHDIDTIAHFAAESHVDRSISGPAPFISTNLVGTFTLLEAARDAWVARPPDQVRFHHVSTDEVFGSLGDADPPFSEQTPYAPNSPYSASKAGSDHLVRSYFQTYGLPVTATNCSNNYGPWQHPEKFIPTVLRSAVGGMRIGVYGSGQNIRDWLFVDDHCRAVDRVVRRGRAGQVYLVGARNEWRNIDLARLICRLLADELGEPPGRYLERIELVADRPGHDARYAVDSSRVERELEWHPLEPFETCLRRTIRWYLDNRGYLELPT